MANKFVCFLCVSVCLYVLEVMEDMKIPAQFKESFVIGRMPHHHLVNCIPNPQTPADSGRRGSRI